MSYIINELKCEHCNKLYSNLYISFGHPEENYKYKWKCKECNKENIEIIPSMFSFEYYDL